jgi:hypothetical protein
MTTTDKTGEKPVASTRRAKTGPSAASNPTSAAMPEPGQDVAGGGRAEAAPAADKADAAPPERAQTVPDKAETGAAFRSAGRVWPD